MLIDSRLDSTEMDHSENEDFTLSSPLPGKKTDKRDDSDLVRVSLLVALQMFHFQLPRHKNNNEYADT